MRHLLAREDLECRPLRVVLSEGIQSQCREWFPELDSRSREGGRNPLGTDPRTGHYG